MRDNFFNHESFEDFMEEKGFQEIRQSLEHDTDFVKEYEERYKHCVDGDLKKNNQYLL